MKKDTSNNYAPEQWVEMTGLTNKTDFLMAVRPHLGFTPVSKEVIYVAPTATSPIDEYLCQHYDEVVALFLSKGYRFVYMPKAVEKLSDELVTYNAPGIDVPRIPVSPDDVVDRFYEPFFAKVLTPHSRVPMLIRYKSNETNYGEGWKAESQNREANIIFSHCELPTENVDAVLMPFFEKYLDSVGEASVVVRFSRIGITDDADNNFNRYGNELVADADQLSEEIESQSAVQGEEGGSRLAAQDKNLDIEALSREIRERVYKLRQLGATEFMLRELLQLPESKPSRLRISQDYKIFLTDYDNREIKMSVLPKVLFFFYLNHPEGVLFKQLSSYRNELMEYYKNLSNRIDLEKMNTSIGDLVDSTKNSVNEKCSLIRSAFVKEFDKKVVERYVITSGKNHEKIITMDRSLLIDESGLLSKKVLCR